MSAKKRLIGALGLSLMALVMQAPVSAQTAPAESANESAVEAATWTAPENLAASSLLEADEMNEGEALVFTEPTPATADELAVPAEEPVDVAQARRRTRNTVSGSDFIGIGADFGYADDLSFAVISKLSFSEQVAIRPSVLLGDDFSILVPVTYEFNQFTTDTGGFRVRPYVGAGASYSDSDDDEDFNLLLAAGADVPLSQRFTLNAQANWGVLNDSQFGATVGVGYNFGRILR